MARNKIESNQAIFSGFDEFCKSDENPVANAGARRWIRTEPNERAFLVDAKLVEIIEFSPVRKIAQFDFDGQSYFICIGFDATEHHTDLSEISVNGGIATAVLAELKPRITASSYEVRQVVEVSDKDQDDNYDGHGRAELLGLFPIIRAFVATDLDADETWRVFFLLSLAESQNVGWMGGDFINVLRSLAGLSTVEIPYQTLCRSIFDLDPSAMFLALYRCMEALYAYKSSTSVIKRLGIDSRWDDVAVILEDELGWYPKEEPALVSLLSAVQDEDVEEFYEAIDETPNPKADRDAALGKRIYTIRNSRVHFRPKQKKINYDKVNWNKLCKSMSNMIISIYNEAFN